MKIKALIFLVVLLRGLITPVLSQNIQPEDEEREKTYQQVYIVSEGDTIPVFQLRTAQIFALRKFKNNKERQAYTKLIRDVKKTYPYAKMIAATIIETYEHMQTLPSDKERQKYLEGIQKEMMRKYKPEMKKMTRTQGRILIKLIDRQCGTSSYEIVKSLIGSFKAGVYNVFAGIFGNSLKTQYDPLGVDAEIEAIVIQLEQGTLDYYYSINYHSFGKY